MTTIVIPFDGSAVAEQILPYVKLYGPLLQADVVLLHSVTNDDQRAYMLHNATDLGLGGFPHTDMQESQSAITVLSEHAEVYLREPANVLRSVQLNVTTSVCVGGAAERIVEEAQQHSEALIMMATHGHSGLRRWTLGSVADRVVHAATVPVFLARSGAPVAENPALRRILLAYDGSELAEQALPIAINLATQAKAELVLLEVVPPVIELAPGFSTLGRPIPLPTDLVSMQVDQASERLQSKAEQLRRPGLTITTLAEMGYPAEIILITAEQQEIDLIVMATHGRSGLQRWMLGSVTNKVVRATNTPLLLVHTQQPKEH